MTNKGYYASTTLVGWRPVVYGPNDETYQVRTSPEGKITLRRIPYVANVIRYLEAFILPSLKPQAFVVNQVNFSESSENTIKRKKLKTSI